MALYGMDSSNSGADRLLFAECLRSLLFASASAAAVLLRALYLLSVPTARASVR
jgi:hypothetical protein